MTAKGVGRSVLSLAALVLVVVLMLVVVWLRVSDAQRSACRQIESVKTVLRDIVDRSAHEIGRPGTAGFAYYHAHPQELRAARENARAELSQFAPGRC